MRWWIGRLFVGYAWGASHWGIMRRVTRDGHPFVALCFGSLAIGAGWVKA